LSFSFERLYHSAANLRVRHLLAYNVRALAQWECGFDRLPGLRMLLEFGNLNLLRFTQGSGRPLTAAWLCFLLNYGCQAPIAANAHVGYS